MSGGAPGRNGQQPLEARLFQALQAKPHSSVSVIQQLVSEDPSVLERLISPKGCDHEEGSTPLHLALRHQSPFVTIEYVVTTGPSSVVQLINAADGTTPLHLACSTPMADFRIISLLLEHGADGALTCVDHQGWTPLHHACTSNVAFDIILFLIEQGPCACLILDQNGQSPFAYVEQLHGHGGNTEDDEVVRCMREVTTFATFAVIEEAFHPDHSLPAVVDDHIKRILNASNADRSQLESSEFQQLLLQHDELQEMLKGEHMFQELISFKVKAEIRASDPDENGDMIMEEGVENGDVNMIPEEDPAAMMSDDSIGHETAASLVLVSSLATIIEEEPKEDTPPVRGRHHHTTIEEGDEVDHSESNDIVISPRPRPHPSPRRGGPSPAASASSKSGERGLPPPRPAQEIQSANNSVAPAPPLVVVERDEPTPPSSSSLSNRSTPTMEEPDENDHQQAQKSLGPDQSYPPGSGAPETFSLTSTITGTNRSSSSSEAAEQQPATKMVSSVPPSTPPPPTSMRSSTASAASSGSGSPSPRRKRRESHDGNGSVTSSGGRRQIQRTGSHDSNTSTEDIGALREKLLRAIKAKKPLGALQSVISKNPKVLELAPDGWTPLHMAISCRAPYKVIRYMVRECPKAVDMVNPFNSTPLHMACLSSADFRVIRLLIEHSPRSATVPDKDGWTPLHRACNFYVSAEIIRYLVQHGPGACLLLDNKGQSPLMYVEKWRSEERNVVHCIMEATLDATLALMDAAHDQSRRGSSSDSAMPTAVVEHIQQVAQIAMPTQSGRDLMNLPFSKPSDKLDRTQVLTSKFQKALLDDLGMQNMLKDSAVQDKLLLLIMEERQAAMAMEDGESVGTQKSSASNRLRAKGVVLPEKDEQELAKEQAKEAAQDAPRVPEASANELRPEDDEPPKLSAGEAAAAAAKAKAAAAAINKSTSSSSSSDVLRQNRAATSPTSQTSEEVSQHSDATQKLQNNNAKQNSSKSVAFAAGTAGAAAAASAATQGSSEAPEAAASAPLNNKPCAPVSTKDTDDKAETSYAQKSSSFRKKARRNSELEADRRRSMQLAMFCCCLLLIAIGVVIGVGVTSPVPGTGRGDEEDLPANSTSSPAEGPSRPPTSVDERNATARTVWEDLPGSVLVGSHPGARLGKLIATNANGTVVASVFEVYGNFDALQVYHVVHDEGESPEMHRLELIADTHILGSGNIKDIALNDDGTILAVGLLETPLQDNSLGMIVRMFRIVPGTLTAALQLRPYRQPYSLQLIGEPVYAAGANTRTLEQVSHMDISVSISGDGLRVGIGALTVQESASGVGSGGQVDFQVVEYNPLSSQFSVLPSWERVGGESGTNSDPNSPATGDLLQMRGPYDHMAVSLSSDGLVIAVSHSFLTTSKGNHRDTSDPENLYRIGTVEVYALPEPLKQSLSMDLSDLDLNVTSPLSEPSGWRSLGQPFTAIGTDAHISLNDDGQILAVTDHRGSHVYKYDRESDQWEAQNVAETQVLQPQSKHKHQNHHKNHHRHLRTRRLVDERVVGRVLNNDRSRMPQANQLGLSGNGTRLVLANRAGVPQHSLSNRSTLWEFARENNPVLDSIDGIADQVGDTESRSWQFSSRFDNYTQVSIARDGSRVVLGQPNYHDPQGFNNVGRIVLIQARTAMVDQHGNILGDPLDPTPVPTASPSTSQEPQTPGVVPIPSPTQSPVTITRPTFDVPPPTDGETVTAWNEVQGSELTGSHADAQFGRLIASSGNGSVVVTVEKIQQDEATISPFDTVQVFDVDSAGAFQVVAETDLYGTSVVRDIDISYDGSTIAIGLVDQIGQHIMGDTVVELVQGVVRMFQVNRRDEQARLSFLGESAVAWASGTQNATANETTSPRDFIDISVSLSGDGMRVGVGTLVNAGVPKPEGDDEPSGHAVFQVLQRSAAPVDEAVQLRTTTTAALSETQWAPVSGGAGAGSFSAQQDQDQNGEQPITGLLQIKGDYDHVAVDLSLDGLVLAVAHHSFANGGGEAAAATRIGTVEVFQLPPFSPGQSGNPGSIVKRKWKSLGQPLSFSGTKQKVQLNHDGSILAAADETMTRVYRYQANGDQWHVQPVLAQNADPGEIKQKSNLAGADEVSLDSRGHLIALASFGTSHSQNRTTAWEFRNIEDDSSGNPTTLLTSRAWQVSSRFFNWTQVAMAPDGNRLFVSQPGFSVSTGASSAGRIMLLEGTVVLAN